MSLATKTVVKPYVALVKKKLLLQQQLDDAKARLAELEPKIVEAFQDEGIQSTKIDDYTVYLNRQLWAGAADDKQAMCDALKVFPDDTWSFLVKDNVNVQTLSARVRECEMNEDGMPILPEALKDLIKVAEVFKIGARKAAKKS